MSMPVVLCDLLVLGSICDSVFLTSVAFSRSSDPGAMSLRQSSHVQHACVCVCVQGCSVCTLVCEVLSDTLCSILSGCVSTLVSFFFLSLQLPLFLSFSAHVQLPPVQDGSVLFDFQ